MKNLCQICNYDICSSVNQYGTTETSPDSRAPVYIKRVICALERNAQPNVNTETFEEILKNSSHFKVQLYTVGDGDEQFETTVDQTTQVT
jgi:hypothetical protein